MTDPDHIRSFYAKCEADIQHDGQTIIGVGDSPHFFYTIGNSRRGLADLIIVGNIDPAAVQDMLNALADYQCDIGRSFVGGDVVTPPGFSLPVMLVACPESILESHCLQVVQINKGRSEPVTVLQELLPDPAGKFPGDERYSWPGCGQYRLRKPN